jgi:D-hydroxyproline dehydrogenase subunit gamma
MLDGAEVALPEGELLCAALLVAGLAWTHESLIESEPRGAFCVMGSCFQCVLEIDGEPHRRACRERVRAGLRIDRRTPRSPAARR